MHQEHGISNMQGQAWKRGGGGVSGIKHGEHQRSHACRSTSAARRTKWDTGMMQIFSSPLEDAIEWSKAWPCYLVPKIKTMGNVACMQSSGALMI